MLTYRLKCGRKVLSLAKRHIHMSKLVIVPYQEPTIVPAQDTVWLVLALLWKTDEIHPASFQFMFEITVDCLRLLQSCFINQDTLHMQKVFPLSPPHTIPNFTNNPAEGESLE